MNRSTTHQRISGPAARHLPGVLFLAFCALSLAGCDSSDTDARAEVAPVRTATLEVFVYNELGDGIAGATVTLQVNGRQYLATTQAAGDARFVGLPPRNSSITIEADGFETFAINHALEAGEQGVALHLKQHGAWAAGRALILGTDAVELAADGTSLTFSVDVAVVSGETLEPIQTLTDANFMLRTIDCGWGGPRDCVSDANGNATGNYGVYGFDSGASAFESLPASVGQAWLAGVLVQRDAYAWGWNHKGPALKSFFAATGSEDAVGLASLQTTANVSTMTVHGPFTNDGATYATAIDALGEPAGDDSYPYEDQMLASLLDSIRWTAAAADDFPGRDATLLLLVEPWLSLAHVNEAVTLARNSGVRISAIGGYSPELALRTGGFVMHLDDMRQYATTFGIMDRALAGELPFYRMQFTVTGGAGTFVPGGNARIYMHVDTPSPIINRGAYTYFDVTIPD